MVNFETMKTKFEQVFDVAFTSVILVAIGIVLLCALDVSAQTNILTGTNAPPAGGVIGSGLTWANLAYIIPFAAPILVLLLKKVVGVLEKDLNPTFIPYICVGIALVIALVLDWSGHLSISPWLWGPIAGALGIGMRELLSKGLSILGLGTPPPDPATTDPETAAKH